MRRLGLRLRGMDLGLRRGGVGDVRRRVLLGYIRVLDGGVRRSRRWIYRGMRVCMALGSLLIERRGT